MKIAIPVSDIVPRNDLRNRFSRLFSKESFKKRFQKLIPKSGFQMLAILFSIPAVAARLIMLRTR